MVLMMVRQKENDEYIQDNNPDTEIYTSQTFDRVLSHRVSVSQSLTKYISWLNLCSQKVKAI